MEDSEYNTMKRKDKASKYSKTKLIKKMLSFMIFYYVFKLRRRSKMKSGCVTKVDSTS